MEQLKSRQGLEDRESVPIEWAERNAQESPHTKELQRSVADTGSAVHRTTIQHTLNNKDRHSRAARKKPFLRPQHEMKHLNAKENSEKPEAVWNDAFCHPPLRHTFSCLDSEMNSGILSIGAFGDVPSSGSDVRPHVPAHTSTLRLDSHSNMEAGGTRLETRLE